MRKRIVLRNLIISQIIISVFLIFAYYIWFPHSFSKLGGFNKTALMLVLVDLILGPLLVFIIFKEDKKYLKFDINILLSIQLIAFIFGAYSLYLKHPAYAVFSGDRFTLTNISQIYPRQHWLQQFKTSFFASPQFVVTKLPQNQQKRNTLMFSVLLEGSPDIDKRPELFDPFKPSHLKTLLFKSIPVDSLFQSINNKEKLTQFYQQNGGKPADYAYFPLTGNNKKDMIWVFNRKTLKPVGIIDADPWLLAKK